MLFTTQEENDSALKDDKVEHDNGEASRSRIYVML
jgi:hypothetical protein